MAGLRTLLALSLAFVLCAAAAGREPVRVVVDRDYAPWSFVRGDEARGILVDQWRLWSERTGIPVRIEAREWQHALAGLEAGEHDVIETIVSTPARRRTLAFSEPYASATASIYFRDGIAGISDLASLQGFPVGVKRGDQHVGLLAAAGATTVIEFGNYDDIVEAARQGKVSVFVADDLPALYRLNRSGIGGAFRHSPPVFHDELRRAVRKSDAALLQTVAQGFAAILPAELAAIEARWVGRPVADPRPYFQWIAYGFVAALAGVAFLVAWNRALRRGILARTAELTESERRFRQIAEAIRQVFWMSTPAMDRLLYASPAYETVWGRSLESLRQDPRSFLEGIHPDDREHVHEHAVRGREAGFEITYRVLRPDGTLRWIRDRGFPVFGEDGKVHSVAGIAEDITEGNAVTEALRQSEFDLAEAQRIAHLGSWTLDVARRRMRWSDELYRIFEIDRDELADSYDRALERICPEDRARVVQIVADAEAFGRRFEVEYRIELPDGGHKHVRAVGYARRNARGEVAELFGTAQDITAHRQALRALSESGRQLQALSRRLVEVQESQRAELARELHDRVGQNLTALNLNLGILSSALPPQAPPDWKARLADSESLVEATATAIRGVLTELRPPMLDDHGLMVALEWQADAVARRSGLRVSVRGGEDPARLPRALELAFFRIAQEALNNVVKHAQARRVTIAVERGAAGHVLSVGDDGIGIDAGKARGGTGLGIVTMRERAQSVGGTLEVRRKRSGGTLLTVRVPA